MGFAEVNPIPSFLTEKRLYSYRKMTPTKNPHQTLLTAHFSIRLINRLFIGKKKISQSSRQRSKMFFRTRVLTLRFSNGYANAEKERATGLSRFIRTFAGDVQIDLE